MFGVYVRLERDTVCLDADTWEMTCDLLDWLVYHGEYRAVVRRYRGEPIYDGVWLEGTH